MTVTVTVLDWPESAACVVCASCAMVGGVSEARLGVEKECSLRAQAIDVLVKGCRLSSKRNCKTLTHRTRARGGGDGMSDPASGHAVHVDRCGQG